MAHKYLHSVSSPLQRLPTASNSQTTHDNKDGSLRWLSSSYPKTTRTATVEDVDENSFETYNEFINGDFDDEDEVDGAHHYPLSGPNPGLASIISQGSKSLEKSAADIAYRTRHSCSLSQPHKKGSFRAGTLEPRQMAEGQRILDVASDCLEELVLQADRGALTAGQRKGLLLSGEPIVFLECVVNRNIKQAKLYWTLPYSLLLDERMHAGLYRQITAKVQEQLMEGGGAKLVSRHVHNRLSSYYPPRIKLFPATDEMVAKALQESK